ncbi:hypothetical protein ONZ43_g871 [Nemania bipapillata]|uniref:Uncharacterized protein n=1 Tax=Nemania bipapillata TaxID=110536 RepID=A0ACC2J6I9_9PEZI|nr:hypothetical protein ONZ43_g871 [Nemania bipapillata]
MTHQVATTGWHGTVSPNMRVGHAMNIVTNSFLAMPQGDANQVINHGVTFERDAFTSSPDKATYEARVMARVNELFKKRQANEHNIQNSLSQAAAQNQAQMMLSQGMQMRGMGQPQQQGFPALQHQMQASPINQQGQPNIGVGPNGLSMNPNQQVMPMGAQMRPQMAMQSSLANLSPQDRVKAHQLALSKVNSTAEPSRSQYRAAIQQKFGPQLMAQLQQENVDPLVYYFQTQFGAQMLQSASKGQAGINQPAMAMQAHQQRPMNQPSQQLPTGPNGEYGPFANMENIINQQKAGLIAQEAGQMVVPASSGAGRNATPQPMGSLPGPNHGPGQPGMPHQLQQQFNHQPAQQLKMDQRAAQTQAQIRAQAQANKMQGQPGGLNGPGGVSQSPAMNTLNAPIMSLPHDKIPETIMRWNASRGAGPIAGRPPPQLGQLGPGNPITQPMNQFTQGNAAVGQHPNIRMQMNQQNQLMMQQLKLQNPNMPQGALERQLVMDNMPLPPKIVDQLRLTTPQGGMSPDMKRWGQLKQWIEQKNLPPQTIQGLLSIQNAQFQSLVKSQTGAINAPPNPQHPHPPVPQQGIHPNNQANPQTVQPTLNMGGPNLNITISPQELLNAKNHERFKGWPDERIRQMLLSMKMQALKNRAAGQMPGLPAPPPQVGQTATAPPSQLVNSASAPQRQQNPGPETSTVSPAAQVRNVKQVQNRPAPNVPAAPTAKGVKRPMPDDAAEVANASNASNIPIQRPHAQQPQPSAPPQIPQLSPEQLAAMTPEQRQKYETMVKNRQSALGNPMSDEMIRLKAIGQEQHQAAAKEQLSDLVMTPEQYRDTAQKIQAMSGEMNKISKILGRWYTLTRNDEHAKLFFKLRMRLIKQYVDGDKMTTLKDRFSMTPADLDNIRSILESMARDVAAHYPHSMRKNLSQQNASEATSQGVSTNTGAPTTQPAPLNAANLEKQTQALNRMHQRNNSRAGQPPAAPTTAQPPFPFGAQSPDGQPTYAGKPAVTQDNLQLPARKKVKTEARAGTGSTQNGPGTIASPQVQKLPSPEMSKRTAPVEAKQPSATQKFFCKDPYCDSRNIGFTSEEILRKHMDDEHVKPQNDPMKFASEGIAEVLGLDANGKVKKVPTPAGNAQSPVDTSKPIQTPTGKAEIASAREAPMKRQASTTGLKPNEIAKTLASKTGTPKPDSLSRAVEGATPGMTTNGGIAPQAVGGEPVTSTIDPQELFTGVTGLEMGGGGAIMDMHVYRALTPNDTPESSKDSALSEPNSDVSEGVTLNVTLNMAEMGDMGFDSWDPFGFGLPPGASNMDLGSVDQLPGVPYSSLAWEEVEPDFDKPFALDTTYFSFDAS